MKKIMLGLFLIVAVDSFVVKNSQIILDFEGTGCFENKLDARLVVFRLTSAEEGDAIFRGRK